MFALRATGERRATGNDALRNDDEAISEGDAEGEECRSNFSSGVDREDAEHEAEEHRAGVAHNGAGKLKIKN